MGYQTFHLLMEVIGILMFAYHFFYYSNKLDKSKVAFPLYIYIAMFPYKISIIFPIYDLLIKMILIYGILTIILAKQRIKINKFEIFFLYTVIITSVINIKILNIELFSISLFNLVYVLLFSFYALNTIKSSEHMKQILNVFIINSVVLAISGIIEHYLVGKVRPEVTLGNPNYYGLYLYISLICFFYLYKKITWKIVLYILVVGYVCVLTGSNTLYLIFVTQIVFWFFSYFNSKKIMVIFGISFVFTIVFYMYTTISLMNVSSGPLQYFVKEDDLTRIYIWNYAWDTFVNNIIQGVGYGNLRVPYGVMEYVTHNDYLRLLGEVGVFGFGILLIYFSSQYIKLIQYDRRTMFFMGSFLIAVLVFSLTHNNLNSILFWFFVSLPFYTNRIMAK